jgi:hypothetical protein
VFDVEVFCDELVLGADVVIEGDEREGVVVGGVRGGGGLAVTEEGGDDDEELKGFRRMGTIVVEGLPFWGLESCPLRLARCYLISLFGR